MAREERHIDHRVLADVARLADGTLPPRRRAAVEARVAESPQLRALLDEQRRALTLVRGAGGTAPPGLRARLESARRAAAPRARRRRIALGGVVAAATTATALALVLTLPGNVPGGPTVVQAAQLGTLPPQAPAPTMDPGNRALLHAAVDGVTFPNWEYRFSWRAVGRRTDRISGRPVTTVYYGRGRLRIAYAIVAGAQVPPPVATGKIIRSHTLLRHFRAGGRTVVTWIRHGHTCVLSARDVPLQAMVGLAAWKDGAGLTF